MQSYGNAGLYGQPTQQSILVLVPSNDASSRQGTVPPPPANNVRKEAGMMYRLPSPIDARRRRVRDRSPLQLPCRSRVLRHLRDLFQSPRYSTVHRRASTASETRKCSKGIYHVPLHLDSIVLIRLMVHWHRHVGPGSECRPAGMAGDFRCTLPICEGRRRCEPCQQVTRPVSEVPKRRFADGLLVVVAANGAHSLCTHAPFRNCVRKYDFSSLSTSLTRISSLKFRTTSFLFRPGAYY